MKRKIIFLLLLSAAFNSTITSQISHTIDFNTQLVTTGTKEGDDRNLYSEVKMLDALYSGEIGSPKLPVYYFNIIVSPETKVTGFTITNTTTNTYLLDHQIYPIQYPIPCGLDCIQPSFVSPNPTIYNSSVAFPDDILSVENQGYFDGANNIVQIKVLPFRYNPTSNLLTFYSSISFSLNSVQVNNNGIIYSRKRIGKNQMIYDEVLHNLVINTEDIPLYSTPPIIINQVAQNGPVPFYEYAIITKPELFPAFEAFIEWKSKKGIQVGLVSIDDIAANYAGDSIFPGHGIIEPNW